MAVRFEESEVRDVGRNSQGVRGIRLRKDDEVIGMEVAIDTGQLLTITENGIVIRTPVTDIPNISRNTQGVRIMRLKEGDKVSTVEKIKHAFPLVEPTEKSEENTEQKEN